MARDTHHIHVSLDTSANPPVTFDKPTLTLKEHGTHRVAWLQARTSPESFTFKSLTIEDRTFNNPYPPPPPAVGSVFTDVNVSNNQISVHDHVHTSTANTYAYTVEVTSNGKTYSSGPGARLEGGTARIINE